MLHDLDDCNIKQVICPVGDFSLTTPMTWEGAGGKLNSIMLYDTDDGLFVVFVIHRRSQYQNYSIFNIMKNILILSVFINIK